MLRLRDLSKRFGRLKVPKDISLEIERGEFVVLVGPSGSAKRPCFNIIAGLEQANGGTVEIMTAWSIRWRRRTATFAMVF